MRLQTGIVFACCITLLMGCATTRCVQQEHDSLGLLSRMQAAIDKDREAQAANLLSQLKVSVQKEGTPLVEGDEATFIVFPEKNAHQVSVKGFFSTEKGNVEVPLQQMGTSNAWVARYTIPPDAQFIYNISIDDKVTEDPLCKRWLIGFGRHSVGRMPKFDPWVDRALAANPPPGFIESFDIKPEKLEGTRKIQVYLPPGYEISNQRYPVLYVHDGPQALVDGKLPQIADYLLADSKIHPMILCFVPPKDRIKEYGAEAADYAEFLTREVVPQIDKRYRTLADPEHRGVTGSSMGGRISIYLVLHHSDVFRTCVSQSAYIEKDSIIIEDIKSSSQLPIRFYLDIGIFERDIWYRDLLTINRELRVLLLSKGYDVIYREWPGDHCWLTWSRGIGEALPLLWPEE